MSNLIKDTKLGFYVELAVGSDKLAHQILTTFDSESAWHDGCNCKELLYCCPTLGALNI